MNQAILFSLLSAPALAGPTAPPLCPFSMQMDDIWCHGYHGVPCVLDPEFCCSTFVGYAYKATCKRWEGWTLTPNDPMPMCGDCSDGGGVAVGPGTGVPSRNTHKAETENSHKGSTTSESSSGRDWEKTRDTTNDVWVDGSMESWRLEGPTWMNTGDKTSTSVRTGDSDSLFNAHLTGENWRDRTSATWDNRNTENSASTDPWGVDWRNWEKTHKGSKTNEQWGNIEFDEHGDAMLSASRGESSTFKSDERTNDAWGQTDRVTGNDLEGSRQGSRQTRNWRDHEQRAQVDHDQWGNSRQSSLSKTRTGDHEATTMSERDGRGNSSTSSKTSTSTTSRTSTSSSSRRGGRRRVADRLVEAEAADVEPSLGDHVNEMLAPSA